MELCFTIELPLAVKDQIGKETIKLFEDYKEFLWYDPQEYRIVLHVLHAVDGELLPKLQEKVEAMLFEVNTIQLFAHAYVIKIASRIDIKLEFQREAHFTRLVRLIADTFAGVGIPGDDNYASVALARYKIPSKQQYSHLKNKLERLETAVELAVTEVTVCKMTEFGKGARVGEALFTVPLVAKKTEM